MWDLVYWVIFAAADNLTITSYNFSHNEAVWKLRDGMLENLGWSDTLITGIDEDAKSEFLYWLRNDS